MRWRLHPGERAGLSSVLHTIRCALGGPIDERWSPPAWLLPHQGPAAQRLAAKLSHFRGALLADAPGLGKTYVGLALATRYRRPAALVPASLVAQWRSVAKTCGVELVVLSHEALSRGADIPLADLLVVDEAHRFRNHATRRYDTLARRAVRSHLLLLTATPVVNHAADLLHLLRLFLPDHGLAAFGVHSIDRAVAARAWGELAQAYAALVVARTPEFSADLARAMPSRHDAAVIAAPPVRRPLLRRLITAIAALEFPSMGTADAKALLRLHLLLRLASSTAALAATLRRHGRYLDHAIAAAERGTPVSRVEAWQLLGREDAAQLDLPGLTTAGVSAPPLDAVRLAVERRRIECLLASLSLDEPADPKADALTALVNPAAEKTIVFAGAVATARYLANRMGWKRLGVATGQGAWIATGRVSLTEALALFAPQSQAARVPPASLQVDTLIATDLVSEGLNLQDASRVIHYDLPWTPLRLEQRVGRIARLGSRHTAVRVAWFLPPEELERRLSFVARIAAKVREQLELGVPTSSRVGHAHVRGGLFEWRERGEPADGQPSVAAPHFVVVRSRPSAVFAIRWTFPTGDVPAVIVMEGAPPVVVRDERRAALVVEWLTGAPVIEATPPAGLLSLLQDELRARLAAAQLGPLDEPTRRLARRIVRRARLAAHARNHSLIRALDLALEHLAAGLAVGATRTLAGYLGPRRSVAAFHQWLSHLPRAAPACPRFTLDGALFGVAPSRDGDGDVY